MDAELSSSSAQARPLTRLQYATNRTDLQQQSPSGEVPTVRETECANVERVKTDGGRVKK
jgi:hypothetical protein